MALIKNEVDTLVIGGGQSGIAMSEHLSKHDIDHLVVEKNRIAEAWRSQRWDSLVTNGPRWNDRFPSLKMSGEPDGFVHHDDLADYFEAYADKINAPIQTNVEVTHVSEVEGDARYQVKTSKGQVLAKSIVVATGPFQHPVIPPVIPKTADVKQLHSQQYKNPDQLPDGAVLVIGSGASGVQIAKELNESGRSVYLSIGPHVRPPRRYRGKDIIWWMGVLGIWNDTEPTEEVVKGFAVSGTGTVDFRQLAHDGITLLGMTDNYQNGTLHFSDDLAATIDEGEQDYYKLLDAADKFIEDNGLDFPEEPEARNLPDMPECVTNPLTALHLKEANITSIIWATGFKNDYSWLDLDIFDEDGKPKHYQGVTDARGVYFLGLPFLTCRGSSFIWGVWHDASHIAHKIKVQNHYDTYDG